MSGAKRAAVGIAVLAAFGGIGGTLYYFSQQGARRELVDALAEASRCIAEGHQRDEEHLAIGLRYRDVEYEGAPGAAASWPQACVEPLDALAKAALDYRSDDQGKALAAAVTELRKSAAAGVALEQPGAQLGELSRGIQKVWDAARAAGIDVASEIAAAPDRAGPLLAGEALEAGHGLADRALVLEVLGSAQNDDRHARFTLKDADTEAVFGYCGIAYRGEARCLRLPEALRNAKTQWLGYSEPGVAPLVYARDEGGQWSVYRAENGALMYTGYAGGAWTAKDYAAAVTDDNGSEKRIVVVEQRGLDAPVERRAIDLADIDPDAERVGDAIVIWEHVLVRTKGKWDGSHFFTLPLPLPRGKVRAQAVGTGNALDFCRGSDAIYVTNEQGRLALRGGRWIDAGSTHCASQPAAQAAQTSAAQSAAESAAEPTIVQHNGALWLGPEGERVLLLDPIASKGQFAAEPPAMTWQQYPPKLLLLRIDATTHLLQWADGVFRPIAAAGPS